MHQLDASLRLEDERAAKGLCPWCGQPATRVVELQISTKPEAGSGRNRGKRLKGTTRRMCEDHANKWFDATKYPRSGGRRKEDRQQ